MLLLSSWQGSGIGSYQIQIQFSLSCNLQHNRDTLRTHLLLPKHLFTTVKHVHPLRIPHPNPPMAPSLPHLRRRHGPPLLHPSILHRRLRNAVPRAGSDQGARADHRLLQAAVPDPRVDETHDRARRRGGGSGIPGSRHRVCVEGGSGGESHQGARDGCVREGSAG